MPEMIGSRIPSTMKLSGLYSAIVFAGSIIRSCGKKAEERKRTTKTSGKSPWTTLALPVRRAIAAPIPPTAIAVAVTSTIAISAPGDAALDLGAEDQPDREEPERGEEAQRRRPRQPPEDDREAGDRRREEAVGEAHLDVDREGDAAAVAGQHQRLHHRPGEHELEEALHRREAGQVDGGAGAAGLDRQQQGGEDDDRRHQLRAAEGLADRAHPQRPHHPQVGRQPRSRLDRLLARRLLASSSRW